MKSAPIWKAGALILCVLAAYWPALHGLFIWDDVTFITDNDLVRSPNGLFNIWFTHDSADYWPLTYTAFWLMWRAFGEVTLYYHLVNLALHIFNAFLIWRILEHLGVRAAYLAALLFAVHPVAVESVAWIFQFKTLLAAYFALGSLWYWMRFQDGKRGAYGVSLALFLCAVLSKTSTVTWPLILLGYTYWHRREWRKSDLRALAPYFLLSLVSGLLGIYWYSYDLLHGGERVQTAGILERALGAGYSFWFYIQKIFLPLNLSFVYPRWEIDPSLLHSYLPLALVLAAFALAWWRRSTWFVALSFFLIAVFPVLGFVDIYFMRFSLVADHWQYLAMPAIVAGAAVAIGNFSYILVPFLLALTFQQAGIYASEESVWRDTLEKNPRAWMAENGLGVIEMRSGRTEDAEARFKRALAEKPDYVEPRLNLGVIALGRGQDDVARGHFEKVLEIFPGHARALNNMAVLALRHQDPESAKKYLLDAVTYLPTYAMGYKNLGIVYLRLNQPEAAREAFSTALHFRADDEEVRRYLDSLGR